MKQTGLFLLFVALLAVMAFGQTETTGDLTGTVKDSSGAVVAGASVTLKSLSTGETQTVTSSASGDYRFPLLKPGSYQVSAVSSSLKSDFSRIDVSVGRAVVVDLVCKVQSVQEVVEVTAGATALNTENANLAATYETKQVLELPAPGGDLTTIAFTVPGIAISTGMGYGNFSSHGLPGTSNLFTINGTDYNDPYLNLNNSGASNLLLGQNEVAEAAVVQNGYSVQYGRQAGAQLNYITKSGANDIHASLIYNWNGDSLNANSWSANEEGAAKSRAISNQYGALISGPVKKNKLFFLADTESLRYTLPSSGVVTIPSPALQAYTLANIPASAAPIYKQAFGVWNSAPGVGGAVPITNGDGPFQDGTGQLGCGDLTGTKSPTGGVFGTGVSCGESWGSTGSNHNIEWLMTIRMDWNISDSQKVYFRYKGDHGFQPTATDLLNPTLNAQSIQPEQEGSVNHTWVIRPNIVNSLAASVVWYSAIFGPANTAATAAVFPTYFGMPSGELGGGSNGGGFYQMGIPDSWLTWTQGRDSGQFQLIDDLSWTKGKHTIKVGVNFRRNRVTDFGDNQGQIGSYFFSDLATFATGVTGGPYYSAYEKLYSPLQDTHIRFYNAGFYAQDEWAITHNLKLTAGIRFDRTGNPTCLDDCFSNLNSPFTSSTFQKGANIPYSSSITTGESQAYYNVTSVVADPRVGMVWSPSGHSSWVVRGGIGLFSDLAPGVLVQSIFKNFPSPFAGVVYDGSSVGPESGTVAGTAPYTALSQYNALRTGFSKNETLAQLATATGGVFSPPSMFAIPSSFQVPNVIEWSFEIQKQLSPKNVVVVTYSGNHGYNLLAQNGWANAYNASGSPFTGLPTAPADPRFSSVTQLTNNGWSNYDGLTIQFRRSLGYGFQGQINYTWSKALDTVSNGGAGEPYTFATTAYTGQATPSIINSYSYADYDIRHNLLGDLLWEMPFKFHNGFAQSALGGWILASKMYVRTGVPFSVVDSQLANDLGGSPAGIPGPLLATATATGATMQLTCTPGAASTPCLSYGNFAAAGTETGLGNLPRNSFRGPGYTSFDFSMYKSFAVKEKYKFTVGASMYNVFNHPEFAPPANDVNGGGFGQIFGTVIPPTSAYGSFQGSQVSGRVIVLNGKFSF